MKIIKISQRMDQCESTFNIKACCQSYAEEACWSWECLVYEKTSRPLKLDNR